MRIIFLLLILIGNNILAQDIPKERLTDWSNVGADSNNSNDFIEYDFYSIRNEMNLSDDEVIAYLIDNKDKGFTRIYLRNGIYYFTKPIVLPNSTAIIGESSENTILEFDLGGKNHLISTIGNTNNDTTFLSLPLISGNKSFSLENNNLKSGDIIYLFDEDIDKISSNWAKYSTGQLIEIESVDNDLVLLKSQIRREYKSEDNPRIITLNLKRNINISNVTIIRKDQTDSQTSNIYFEYVKDASVSCVRSYNSNFAHITIANSLNNQVTGSYFQDGFDYGGGGKAYGVMLQFATSECLVYNNQFNHLRHSMILQAGPNGNVISYNYSENPFWTDVSLPANSAGDLVLHGNYVYSNLLEGNTVQHIVIDDSHGQNGKHNTFLRNRAELYGLFMNPGTPSDGQNFIGNEITNTGFLLGNYFLSGDDHFEYGNNVKGNTTPSNTNNVGIESLYLSDKLDYYDSENWPPIGLPNKIEVNKIEAEHSNSNEYLTACDYILSSVEIESNNTQHVIYPNPVVESSFINIRTEKNSNDVKIYNLLGVVLFEKMCNDSKIYIDISKYSKGLYLIDINGKLDKFLIQ